MSDVDVLDMLFDKESGILGGNCGVNQSVAATTTSTIQQSPVTDDSDFHCQPLSNPKMMMMDGNLGSDVDSDWSSAFLTSSLDGIADNEFFNALMETNLPDDVKQQQLQQPQQKQVLDHAYSISVASPTSDSGISSTGPYSPSNSSNSVDDLTFDIERDLFGPLDLKSYDEADSDMVSGVDPMLLDSISESDSNSSPLAGNESPVRFDFDELASGHSQPAITISTDETTKVIKVVSVNGSTRNQTLQHLSSVSSKQKQSTTSSPYPELMLSDEEKDLLSKEGISLPSHLPLTREEEKVLRSVRRRIRNKASARNSRRKKQDYMEALEKRVKLCTDEKRQLEKKVNDLEKRNSSLIGQLKKLQRLVTDTTRQTAKTGTCAMILALSFALVLLPNYRSLIGNNDTSTETLLQAPSDIGGRPARSLLSKADEYIAPKHTEKSFKYAPFLNLNNLPSQVSPAREPISDPVDGDKTYVHEPIDDMEMVSMKNPVISSSDVVDEKVIHMEITKLPDTDASSHLSAAGVENQTAKSSNIQPEEGVRHNHRHIHMDLSDEL